MFIYMGSAYNCGTQNATLVKNEKQKTQPIAEADFIKGNSQVLLMFSILPVERGTFPQFERVKLKTRRLLECMRAKISEKQKTQ